MDRYLRVGLYDECGVYEVFEFGWHALYRRFLGCGGGDYDGEDAEGGGCGEWDGAGCRVDERYRPGDGVIEAVIFEYPNAIETLFGRESRDSMIMTMA